MSACECGQDGDACRCWELEAGKYNHDNIRGQIRIDELRDERYGPGGSP